MTARPAHRPAGGREAPEPVAAPFLRAGALLGLVLLVHSRALVLPLLGEDTAFLDTALRRPLSALLTEPPPLGGAWRPLARELHWWLWGAQAGFDAGGLHLVNVGAFFVALLLLYAIVARWLGPRPAAIAALTLAVFPPVGAALAWASRVQELAALAWVLAALVFHQRGRPTGAGVAAAAATFSWEGAAVVPLLLGAYDACGGASRQTDKRGARLVPPVVGVALALGLGLLVRGGWPRDVPSAWTAGGLGEVWRLPFDFARAWWPPSTMAGAFAAVVGAPIAVALSALVAMLAVPGGRGAAIGSRVSRGSPLRFAVAWVAIAALPVAVLAEPWRGTSFLLAAPGLCIAIGVALARAGAWPLRIAYALAAVVAIGANYLVTPVRPGAERHDLTLNEARVRAEADRTALLLARIEPWCAALRGDGETFVTGMERDANFAFLFGPGLRVACRDTGRVRPLAELTPELARGRFGLLRFDAATTRFAHEAADARVRRLIGENVLVRGRLEVGVALLETSLAERDDPEVRYLLTAARAASGDSAGAAAAWAQAIRDEARPRADSLTARMLAGLPAALADSAFRATRPLVRAVLLDPGAAAPHAALGRQLLAYGRPRTAALELGLAYGIAHRPEDLAWLATAYEGIGATEEARAAYQQALAAGMRGHEFDRARDRFMRLEAASRGGATPRLDRPATPP